MAARTALALVVAALFFWPASPSAQGAKAPSLSKDQKQALQAAVTAASTARQAEDADGWQMHLLRASDGSHYVAFSLDAPPDLSPRDRLALYVRLEPKPTDPPSTSSPPRSAVEEWLRGERSDPLPMRARRVVTVPTGELPMGGTAATMTRDGSGQNAAVIALMERQLQKQREEAAAREKARRDEMEGKTKTAPNILPFEDFDLKASVQARGGGRSIFRRAVTAGPGDYDLVVSWAVLDDRNRPTKTGAVRHALSLAPVQTTGLALGSLILADAIRARTEFYSPDQQTAHPYAIGGTEIDPAEDHTFTNDERLSVAFQIFNATPSPTGKPDVGVAMRLFRQTPAGEELAASLAPLDYTESTLPADFNLFQGHPLLAAFAAPLRTLPRGDYRLAVAATDRLARISITADTRFRIGATGASLLAGAPAFTTPFARARLVQPPTLDRILDAIAPDASSPSLALLMAMARQSRFVDLIADRPVGDDDRGTAMLLQTVAAYAVGDTPRALGVRIGQAREARAPAGAAQFWLGAILALESRDAEAERAWRESTAAGWPPALSLPLIAEAQVRQGRLEEAERTAREALAAGIEDERLVRIAAAMAIAARRYAQAVDTLTPHLARVPEDLDAQWLLVHALFGTLVGADAPPASAELRARLREAVDRYVSAGGRHRGLAEEWKAFATSSSAAVP